MNFSIIVEPNPESLVTAAAERFVTVAQTSVADHGRFIFALAGGSTPRALYETLSSSAWRERVPWEKVHVFFGDERAVPPDDEYSNGRMAREALLDKVEIPPQNLHFMRGDAGDLDAAARAYEAELRALGTPLDLALLGMGEDGHTASLFPDTPALHENERWCVATTVAPLEPHVPRLTLTYPAFNEARQVWVLVTGASKAERVAAALGGIKQGILDITNLPVQGVQPENGHLIWMLDAAAARYAL